jgi:hypothetical protein
MPQVWYENHRFPHQKQGLLPMGDYEMTEENYPMIKSQKCDDCGHIRNIAFPICLPFRLLGTLNVLCSQCGSTRLVVFPPPPEM